MLNRQNMHIYLDNLTYSNDGATHQLSDIIRFVTQYRFQGGPEQPLRYLEMIVNKNDIDLAYPHLIDSVVEGKTRLLIDAVGSGTFIITKLWLNDNQYELVATGIEITLNTATLSSADITEIGSITDPPKIIRKIFDRWKDSLYLTTADDGYTDDFKIYYSSSVDENRTAPGYEIAFKENMPTLVAINMCALLDNAFIFFANKVWDTEVDSDIYSEFTTTDEYIGYYVEVSSVLTLVTNGNKDSLSITPGTTVPWEKRKFNTLHYVRYDDINPLAYNPGNPNESGIVNIYPRMDSQYENYTKFDLMMFKQMIGMSSKNSEGSETIVNNQIVSMDNGSAEASSTESMRMYGDYAGATVISDLMVSSPYYPEYPDYALFDSTSDYVGYYVEYNSTMTEVTLANKDSLGITAGTTVAYIGSSTAQEIANNLVRRYKDPTRSITITLSEIQSDDSGSGWEEAISPFSYAKRIVDNVNNITLTNTHLCDGQTDNFMLRLSTFVRMYPEIVTEYTFGVMKETTLSQELANKLTGMSGSIADMRCNGVSIVTNGIVTVDSAPIDGSNNPISSDAVYDALAGKQKTITVSSSTPTGGSNGDIWIQY